MTHALPHVAAPDIDTRHWLAAFGVAAALHAAVFLQWPAEDQAGAEAPGVDGISVSIAMTASLAGAEQAASDPALAEQVPVEDAATAERVTEPEPVEPNEMAMVEASEVPVEPAPADPVVQPIAEPTVAESIPVEEVAPAEPIEGVPEVVSAVEPPPEEAPVAAPMTEVVTEAVVEDVVPPRAPTRPKTVKAEPVEPPVEPASVIQTRKVEEPQAEPVQAVPPAPSVQQAVQPAETQTSASSAAATVSSGQAQNAPTGKATDVRNSTGGAAVSAPSPNYIAKLRLWLERHKDYPKMARRKRMQGVVLLYFRVGRDGEVLAQEVREASGHVLLDDAALEMLARAAPLPEFPEDMSGDYLDVVLPVEYSLRGNR